MASHRRLIRVTKGEALSDQFKQRDSTTGLLSLPVEVRISILEYVLCNEYRASLPRRGWWLKFTAVMRGSRQLRFEAETVIFRDRSLMLSVDGETLQEHNETSLCAVFIRSADPFWNELLVPVPSVWPPLTEHARSMIKDLEIEYWHLPYQHWHSDMGPDTAVPYLMQLSSLRQEGWTSLRSLKVRFHTSQDSGFDHEQYGKLQQVAKHHLDKAREDVEKVEVEWRLHSLASPGFP